MPPLCTAGYGLAMGKASFFFGAFYLFFINTVFISLATYLGVRMMHFRRKQFVNAERLKVVNRYILGVVVLTMLPAGYMTVGIIRKSVTENNIRKFVKNECSFSGTQIISQSANEKSKTLNLVAVGKVISNQQISRARTMMGEYQLDGYRLNIIQGSQSDSILLSQALASASTTTEGYEHYASLGAEISKETRTVWPGVTAVSVSRVADWKTDTTKASHYVMAVVSTQRVLSASERARMQSWLKERTHADSLRLIVTR